MHASRPARPLRSATVALVVATLLALVYAVGPAGAAAATQVGVVGPNVLVRPTDAPTTADRARLVAAGGEFESAQVVVRAVDAAVTGLDVQVTGQLAGPGGARIPASAITVYREGYYDAKGLPSDGDLHGALGRFPDMLIPAVDPFWGEARRAFPIDVPTGENRLAWIDVLVPAGTAAGTFTGALIHVTAGGRTLADVPLEVEVADLDLPSTTSLDGGFDINPNRLCQVHACGTFPGGQAGLLAMYEQIALDDRLTLAKPPTPTPSGPADASYRTYTRPLLVGTARTRLVGARLRTVTVYQWAKESADEWRRIAEADGLLGRIRFHCDEIGSSASAWSACRTDWQRANALWRGAATGAVSDLPLQVTASAANVAWGRANGFADLADRISTLVPAINLVHPKTLSAFPGDRGSYAAWGSGTTAGGAARSLWAYTSCMSMGCSANLPDDHTEWTGWPSYGVDQPPSEARAMGWMAYEYDLRGEYYYETARDLPTAWTDLWSDDGGNHGDGTLFYPGTVAQVGGQHDVAIESIRLKRIRDGREDHELLLAANAVAGRERVLAIARGAFASAHATDVPQSRIEAARAQLLGIASGTTPRSAWPVAVTGVTAGGAIVDAGGGASGGTGGSGSPSTGADGSAGTGTGSGSGSGSGTGTGTPSGTTTVEDPTRVVRGVLGGTTGVTPGTGTGGVSTRPGAGAAASRVFCGGRRATIVGSARADVLRGTAGVDVIAGMAGNDRISGLGHGDVICGGTGDDVIVTSGDRGSRDVVVCGTGRDVVVHDARDRVLAGCERRTRRA